MITLYEDGNSATNNHSILSDDSSLFDFLSQDDEFGIQYVWYYCYLLSTNSHLIENEKNLKNSITDGILH